MDARSRVLIVEDHTLFRAALRAVLAHDADFHIVGEADNGQDAIHLSETLAPDLVLMDLGLPRLSGIQATREIKQRRPRTRVLVLTAHSGDEYIYESLKAGADGYVLKEATHAHLRTGMVSVLEGYTYLSPAVLEKVIAGYLDGSKGGAWSKMTGRERQVLTHVAQGHPNKHIARCLSISVKTVNAHRSRLMKKLELKNAAMLTAYAIEKCVAASEMDRAKAA